MIALDIRQRLADPLLNLPEQHLSISGADSPVVVGRHPKRAGCFRLIASNKTEGSLNVSINVNDG